MIKTTLYTLSLFLYLNGTLTAQKRVDGWYEIDYVTAATPATERLINGRESKAFHYDTVDKKNGDFSILYTHEKSPRSSKIGFTSYPFPSWKLVPETYVHLWLKVEGNDWDSDERFRLTIRDAKNNGACYNLSRSQFRSGDWVQLDIPLSSMDGINSVNLSELNEIYLDTRMPRTAVVKFDDVYFHNPSKGNSIFGVTDKTIPQRILEARYSKNLRAFTAYSEMAKQEKPPVMSDLFALFWYGKDLKELNKKLINKLTNEREILDLEYGFKDSWHLFATPWILRMYECFGPGDMETNGRLNAKAQAILLKILWERTKEKNDIHWARARSPWYMDGSENHDLNMVVANYLSSQIFASHPDYMDRVFPNKGTGGGSGYWFHRKEGDARFYGPYGEAELSDGKDYTAQDHYQVWGEHLKEVFRERAKKGFFLEQASPSYMKYSLGFIQDVYEFTDDSEMKDLTKSFLDLVWTTWAMESLHGLRGGAKTRDHLYTNVNSDSMYNMSKFLFGGMMTGGLGFYQLPAMEYEFPLMVWELALDREGLGEFASVSSAIGEEPGKLPRNPGLERTLNLDTEHRMFRYAWITPEYILGAQMDHPHALHSHLSIASRNFGILYATDPNARVFPYGVKKESDDWEMIKRAGIMSRTVQHKNVLISQQARNYLTINPQWFPQRSVRAEEFGIYISPLIDRIEEKDGWVFIEEGNAYSAIRIVAGEYTASDRPEDSTSFTEYNASESLTEPLANNTYLWNKDRTLLVSKDPFYPVIWDTSSKTHYNSLEAFMEAVLKNRIELIKTVVPGWHRLVYEGTGNNPATLSFNTINSEIPEVNGVPLNYTPKELFNSPYIRSETDSGVIEFIKGTKKASLDFTK